MNFQVPSTTSATGGEFSFGATNTTAASGVAQAASKPSPFSFGSMGSGDAGSKPLSFGLGSPAATANTVSNTGIAQAAVTSKPSFGLGATAATSFGFGGSAATTTSAAPLGTLAATAPAQSSSFGFGNTVNPTQTAASTTAAPQPTAAASTAGFSFGSQAATAAAPAASAANTVLTTAAAAPIQAATAPTASKSAAPGMGGFATLNTATKTTEASEVANAPQLTYSQLEEHINKWTLELEEQEKIFTAQATQINAWDKILISNNQMIVDFNDAVQKVKSDQQTVEQELEFIATQHKELEECLIPLQKELLKTPQLDVERSQTYLMVENLDTQFKQMSEDLKEIIDSLNDSNKCQDSTDPMIQIGKIMNAHISSLQWIEQNNNVITNKLEELDKMHMTFKRDSEKSFRSAYYN